MADRQLQKLADEFKVVQTDKERDEIRHEAQRRTNDHRFSPKALLEWRPDAFAMWCVTYVPHIIPEIEDWQVESLDAFFANDRLLLLWPATCGKTTLFCVVMPLWIEIGDPNLEGIGVFKDDDDAKSALQTIKNEASENEKIIADFGQLKPAYGNRTHKWTQHRVDFAQRTRRSKQSSLMFFPYGSAVLGKRSNWRFADDIVTRKVAMSQTLNRQQIQWFQVDFESGPYAPQDKASYVEGRNKLWVPMTRMTPEDLGHHLETRVTDDVARANPHVRPFKVMCVDLLDEERERTITPRYTWGQAKAMEAEMGSEAFAMRYRNKVVTDKTAKFKRVYIEGGEFNGVDYPGCWDESLTYEDAFDKSMTVSIGYDPASGSESKDAAEAALTMLGNIPDGGWHPVLLDFYRARCEVLGDKDENSQLMRIVRMARRCNAVGIKPWVLLEDNGIQRALKVGILEAAQRHGVELRCSPAYTGVNKWDERTGLEQSVIDFENGWLRIPGRFPTDRTMFKPFADAMCAYGVSAFIDVPISYWKARQWLFDHRGQHGSTKQVVVVPDVMPPRMRRRLERMGMAHGLVIRDAYASQQEEQDGQRVA